MKIRQYDCANEAAELLALFREIQCIANGNCGGSTSTIFVLLTAVANLMTFIKWRETVTDGNGSRSDQLQNVDASYVVVRKLFDGIEITRMAVEADYAASKEAGALLIGKVAAGLHCVVGWWVVSERYSAEKIEAHRALSTAVGRLATVRFNADEMPRELIGYHDACEVFIQTLHA